jgi:hypothetical protein
MTVNSKRIRTGYVDKQTGEVQLNKPDETAQHTPRPWYVAYDLGGGHRGCLIASNGLENGYGIVKGEVHYRTDSDWLEEAAPAPGPWTVEVQDDLDVEGNGYRWAVRTHQDRLPPYSTGRGRDSGLLVAAKAKELNYQNDGSGYVQNPAYANSEANARLIAAAPALLAAAEAVRPYLNRYVGGGRAALDAAIAQAKGAA